jgi:hypothetical protein
MRPAVARSADALGPRPALSEAAVTTVPVSVTVGLLVFGMTAVCSRCGAVYWGRPGSRLQLAEVTVTGRSEGLRRRAGASRGRGFPGMAASLYRVAGVAGRLAEGAVS